jgi:hypothetical protein
MAGCVQGLIGSLKTASAPPPANGKYCTSFQVSVACCDSTGVCAPEDLGLGATCSPVMPGGWTYDC